MPISAPRWDLSNVYSTLESGEFNSAVESFKDQVGDLGDYFIEVVTKTSPNTPASELAPILGEVVDRFNAAYTLSATIEPFIYSFVSTDSRDKTAMRVLSEFEQINLPLKNLQVQLKKWLGSVSPTLPDALELNTSAKAHTFMLQEAAEQSRFLMSEAEEALAEELSLSGGNAWDKLQGTVTSQLVMDFELDGETQKLPMPALINLRSHSDEATRHRAYDAENAAWNSVRETLAACLNGVKGEGAASLCSLWRDPDFDPKQRAFYYARVLENPTCRWSQRLCVDAGVDCAQPETYLPNFSGCCLPTHRPTVQERAWSSPIWYSP